MSSNSPKHSFKSKISSMVKMLERHKHEKSAHSKYDKYPNYLRERNDTGYSDPNVEKVVEISPTFTQPPLQQNKSEKGMDEKSPISPKSEKQESVPIYDNIEKSSTPVSVEVVQPYPRKVQFDDETDSRKIEIENENQNNKEEKIEIEQEEMEHKENIDNENIEELQHDNKMEGEDTNESANANAIVNENENELDTFVDRQSIDNEWREKLKVKERDFELQRREIMDLYNRIREMELGSMNVDQLLSQVQSLKKELSRRDKRIQQLLKHIMKYKKNEKEINDELEDLTDEVDLLISIFHNPKKQQDELQSS